MSSESLTETVVIRFYRSEGEYGFLSNLGPALITFEGRSFRCSEAAYQFGKPKDPMVGEWLMQAPKPDILATSAHALLSYRVKSDWNEIKVQRMRDVLWAKFTQHPHLREQLLATGDAILVEASRTDSFWGEGANRKGENMLGKLLMETREKLRGWVP